MNSKITVFIAVVIFAMVGTMVFSAIVPYLSEVNARGPPNGCPESSPDVDGPSNGCGPLRFEDDYRQIG